jgi:hypothetical protein
MRRLATLLLALSLAVPLPAWAGWTKQANGQWTGLSYLHCIPWGTNGTYCYDEYASSATNELVRVLPDLTVEKYNGPTFPTTYGMAVGLGTSSAGLHFVYNEADCKIASYYTSSATASSWTPSFTGHNKQGGGVILGPSWGSLAKLVAPTLYTGFSPARGYPIHWTTGSPTDGGYTESGFSSIYCNTRTIGSGCARNASNSDWLLGWSSPAQFTFVYGTIDSSYASGPGTKISMSGQITASSGCASDGSTSVLGVRRVSAGQSYLVQQGSVTTTQQYSTDLIVGYAGAAFTGSSARFAISVDGVMWTATSGAFADVSGTSLDITLDASDKVSGFALAPDGTTPMVVTKEGDVWTWAASSSARPRRTSLSGSLGGTMRGGL